VSKPGDISGSVNQARDGPPSHGEPVRVGWIASDQTWNRLSGTLGPLAVGLADELLEVAAMCPEDVQEKILPSPPMAVIRYRPPGWPGKQKKTHALAERLREGKVRLLHALDAPAVHLTRRLARLLGCPYVVSAYRLGDGQRIGHLDDLAAAALAAGEEIHKELVGRRCLEADAVHIVRPGVHQVSSAACSVGRDRRPAVVADDVLSDFASTEAVLTAFAQLKQRGLDCVFFLIGAGPAERRLRKRAETLEITDVLTFVDRLTSRQLSGILKAADVYICPRAIRGVNLSILLAMAAGVPVLAPADDGADFLTDGRTARIFRARDAEDLSAKLAAMLEDGSSATDLANGALAHLCRHHRPARMVAAVAEVYRSVLR